MLLCCLSFTFRANATQLLPECSPCSNRPAFHVEKKKVHPTYKMGSSIRRLAVSNEPYAEQSPDSATLIFYYDYNKSSREGRVFDVKTSYAPANGLGALAGDLTDFAPAWTFSKKIHKVIITPSFHSFKPTDTFTWFYGMSNVDTIQGLKYINMSNVDDMGHMFRECTSLVTLDVSELDVSHVTEMLSVFNGDKQLHDLLGLSNWNVSQATFMRSMFQDCQSLTTVEDLSGWDVRNVTDMKAMFQGCTSIPAFDPIYQWDVSSVTNMNSMFKSCTLMTTFDPSAWEIGKSTDLGHMFESTSLTAIDLSNNGNIETLSPGMFQSCTQLESVFLPNGLRKIGTAAKTSFFKRDVGSTFSGCSNLRNIILPDSLTLIGYQSFMNCSSLEMMTIPNTVTTIGTSAFSGCTSLRECNVPNGITSLDNVFQGCRSLVSIKIPNSVVNFGTGYYSGHTFEGCTSLTHVTLPSRLQYVTTASFKGTHITSITLPATISSDSYYNDFTGETKPDFSGMASLKEIFLLGDTIYKTLQDCTGLQNDSNLTIYVKKSLYDKVKGTYPNAAWKKQYISLGYLIPVEMTSHYKSICRDFDVDLKANVPAENQIEAALPVAVNDERSAVAMRTISYVPSRTRANLIMADSTQYKGLDNYVGAILYGESGKTYYYTIGEDDYTQGEGQKTMDDVLTSSAKKYKEKCFVAASSEPDAKDLENATDFDNGDSSTADVKLVGANDERYTGPENENASGIVYNNYGLKDGAFHIYGSDGYTAFNRAFLSIAQIIPAAKASIFNIEFVDANGTVTHVTTLRNMIQELDNSTYDLQGRKVSHGYKGIVIRQGRKYLHR